jgi:hypothetical protein
MMSIKVEPVLTVSLPRSILKFICSTCRHNIQESLRVVASTEPGLDYVERTQSQQERIKQFHASNIKKWSYTLGVVEKAIGESE